MNCLLIKLIKWYMLAPITLEENNHMVVNVNKNKLAYKYNKCNFVNIFYSTNTCFNINQKIMWIVFITNTNIKYTQQPKVFFLIGWS